MIGRSELWRAVHHDLVDKCAATAPQVRENDSYVQKSLFRTASHDIETVERRAKHEGDSFYTLTLPAFGKEFLRTLDRGCLLPTDFEGWSRCSYIGSSAQDHKDGPKFLNWALQVVFAARHVCSAEPDVIHPSVVGGVGQSVASQPWIDPETGEEDHHRSYIYLAPFPYYGYDDDWAAESVHAILQLSGLYSKEKSLASDAKNREALDRYVTTDTDLSDHLAKVCESDFPQFADRVTRVRKVISIVFAEALSAVDREVYEGELLPKHGPGATADKLIGNEKWLLSEWTERLDKLFNHEEYLYSSDSTLRDSFESIEIRTPDRERPVKVILVPKTQATPRVIAIEPTCMQYVQQGFMRTLVPKLENSRRSSSFVGFTDQDPNRRLAALGSSGGNLATLDLSEASDRVANWLVEELFADFPYFLEGVQACRSTRAGLPDGRIIELVKFASMGSAMTFPIEAMVFSAICLEAVVRARSMPLTASSIRAFRGKVRVFGDDIIVPADTAEQVADSLESFGFKVNRHKSFWTGEFRESCGEEFWRGRDVTHVKVRTEFPSDLRSAREVISTSSTRNQLFEAGFVEAVEVLDKILLKVTRGVYPIVEPSSPLLGRLSLDRPSGDGWDSDLHVPVAAGYVPVAKIPVNKLDGARALLKYFLSPSEDEEHLTRSGRPRVVRRKLAMAPVF